MRFFFDTSVIASLYLDEIISKRSNDLIRICYQNRIDVRCTELVNYELSNTLLKNQKADPIGIMERFRTTFFTMVGYNLTIEDMSFQIASETGLSFYDAVHVSSAKAGSGFLVTNDKEILKKVDVAINVDETIDLLEMNSIDVS